MRETERFEFDTRTCGYSIYYRAEDGNRRAQLWVAIDAHEHWAFIETHGEHKDDPDRCWIVDYFYTHCVNKRKESIPDAILEAVEIAKEFVTAES